MEDVELAMQLKESGTTLFIPGGVTSSTRRWTTKGYSGNFLMVLWLTGAFLVLRRLGLIRGDGDWFYRVYYPAKS
jgi:hypothetical protein